MADRDVHKWKNFGSEKEQRDLDRHLRRQNIRRRDELEGHPTSELDGKLLKKIPKPGWRRQYPKSTT
jgi:hypothetical protein